MLIMGSMTNVQFVFTENVMIFKDEPSIILNILGIDVFESKLADEVVTDFFRRGVRRFLTSA